TMEIPGDIVVAFSEVKNKGTVIFTNDSEGAETYVWDFGDGKTSTEKAPTHIYTTSDTYKVNLIAQNGGVSKGLSRSIVVDLDVAAKKPKAAFTPSTFKCKAPCEVTFTNGSEEATNFNWNFGNGVTSTLKVPDKITFTEPKTYKVVLNVTG
ncbi:PKD domain-containing protein, partial [Xanthomonas citri pv. citri]